MSDSLSVSLPSNVTTAGNIALYSCAVGFNRAPGGDFIRVCLPSGDWSGVTPQCIGALVFGCCDSNGIHCSSSSFSN